MITVLVFLALLIVTAVLSWRFCTARFVLCRLITDDVRAVAVNDAADMATDGAE